MAYATLSIPGDGSTTLITASFPLGWIDTPDVRIRVSGETDGAGNDVYRTYTRISDSLYQVNGTPATVSQKYIVERRVDKEELLVDWEDGDAITEENLNKAQKQAIMLTHEALDAYTQSAKVPEGQEGPEIIMGAENTTLIVGPNNTLIAGPTTDEISNAQENAESAAASLAGTVMAAANAANAALAAQASATEAALSASTADNTITARMATDSEIDAGLSSTALVSPSRLTRWFTNWASKLYGTDSIERSSQARFGDVVDLDDWLDGSGNTSTVSYNNTKLAALIAYMNGAGAGKTYRSRKGRIFAISSAFTIPAVKIRLEGAVFRYIGNTLSGTPLITLNGTDFDSIRVHLPTGSFRLRLIGAYGVRGDFIDVWADAQTNNYNTSNIDWAVLLYGRNSLGQENRIGEIRIAYFNRALGIVGDAFNKTDPQKGGYVNYISIKGYEKGVMVRNCEGISLRGGWIREMSSSAVVGSPGNNGLLIDGAASMFVQQFLIEDAPEHGVRIAGDVLGVEMPSHNNIIRGITIKRARQCGFKMWTGIETTLGVMRGGVVSDIIVEDSSWGNATTTGFNYSAFLLQNLDNINFSNLQARAVDQSYCGREAFYLSGWTRVTAMGLKSYNGGRVHGYRISQYNDGNPVTPGMSTAFNQNQIHGYSSEGHTAEGVYLEFPDQSIRDLTMTGGSLIGGTDGFGANAAAARFVQPSSFGAAIRGQSGARFNLPGTGNIKLFDLLAPYIGTTTFDPPSLVDGAGVTATVTVTGASLGDAAIATFTNDIQGITVTAWVSAANTVSVRFQNETGATVDLTSGTLKAEVRKS